ncbi:MAG: TonB-dependent receptor, partial [Roseimicrobium sp.]
IRGPEGDVRWETMLFYQGRRFESTFSSVNEDRTAETPALDQYEVPAHSLGFSFTTTFAGGIPLPGADKVESKLVTGVDARWIEGETREHFRFVDGAFLNDRRAGGTQWLVGAFAEQMWKMSPDLLIVMGGRADYWSLQGGSRVERSIATGTTLLDDEFPDRDGVVANGRLGAVYSLTQELKIKTSAYTGFRVPTLNELYRPFRVRNDITGANDALEPERLVGLDLGMQWDPDSTLHFGVTAFWNRLSDAVANVTVQQGPGVAPDGTVIPDGGVFRQRQNLEAVSTVGVELEAQWKPAKWMGLSAGYLFTHTEVSTDSGDLDGNELAQAPAHVFTGALTWHPHERWQVLLQARYGSEQFEDDLNDLVLGSYIVWDAAITCRLRQDLSVSLVAENLFDRTVETGRSGDGLVTVGAPRWIGVKMKWEF